MQLSEKFRIALKSSPVRMYRLAQQVGLHPCTLSKVLCGIASAKADDPRLLSLGALLGLKPEELFDEQAPTMPPGDQQSHPVGGDR